MINNEQYLLLKEIYNKNEVIAIVDNINILMSLSKQGYCDHLTIDAVHHFYKNGNTLSAILEYENFVKEENRKDKSIEIAENANKKATHSNIISWISIGVALLGVIASIVVPIVIKIYFP